jgi:hypothetical protein
MAGMNINNEIVKRYSLEGFLRRHPFNVSRENGFRGLGRPLEPNPVVRTARDTGGRAFSVGRESPNCQTAAKDVK